MDYKNACKKCIREEHCCIFNDDSEFAFAGIKSAKNIKRHIKKDYSYFLNYSPLSKKAINDLKYDDPSLEGRLRYFQLDNKRILRLKTQKNKRCIFLEKSGRCSIYNIRPNICRIYPFWAIKLINGKFKVIKHDSDTSCNAIRSIMKQGKDIEKVLSPKEISEIKKVMKNIEKEDIFYRKNIKKFVKEAGLEK